jgi:hypothetical protein
MEIKTSRSSEPMGAFENGRTRPGYRLLLVGILAGLFLCGQACGGGGSSTSGAGQPTPPSAPSIGASVAENLETAVVYVDAANGNDNNNGAKNSPFQTINKALLAAAGNNQKGVGTQVNVNPGLYREQLQVQASQTSLPFTLQAVTPGTVFVSGADSLAGNTWTVSSYGPNIYTNAASASYVFAACPAPPGWPPVAPVVLRREMVFVNGLRLNQVMSANELQPDTFWADAGGSNQIYMWPPAGTSMPEADIELATTSRSPLISTDGVNNFVIRGLTFEYDDSCIQLGPRVVNATNVLIDNDQFLWSNATGFGIFAGSGSTQNVTIQNSVANHNGQIGFGGNQVKYVLYQNDESSYNGWRGALGAFGFNGSYFFLYHNCDFNGYSSYYNQGGGVHFDTDHASDQVTGLKSGGNTQEGLTIEASEGPFLVQSSAVCSNSLTAERKQGNIGIDDSSYVTLTGNTLYNGGGEQVYILGNGRAGTNWEQPTVPLVRFNQDFTETNNTYIGTADQLGFYTYYKNAPSCSVPISDTWLTFASTFSSQTNTWGDTVAKDSSFPFFRAAILGGAVPLSVWQSAPPEGVGQDSNSTFVPEAAAPEQCALPNPDLSDFWLVVGPRQGAAVVVPQAGGPAVRVPFSLFSLGFTGDISLSLDTTQAGGPPLSGVTASFSPGSVTLSPTNPPVPIPGTLTLSTTSAVPNGSYALTMIATDGLGITRTATFFLQVGSPSALEFSGNDAIKAGSCARFQIRAVDANGNVSDVLNSTYLTATGTGSGHFYQDSRCSTLVSFNPINPGCPAGIEIPAGHCCPLFSGTRSIWFMDAKVENLNITISDEANVLSPATKSLQVQ